MVLKGLAGAVGKRQWPHNCKTKGQGFTVTVCWTSEVGAGQALDPLRWTSAGHLALDKLHLALDKRFLFM